MLVLSVFALLGFFYSIFQFVRFGEDAFSIFLRSCDIITIVIPPALPIAMTSGILSSFYSFDLILTNLSYKKEPNLRYQE